MVSQKMKFVMLIGTSIIIFFVLLGIILLGSQIKFVLNDELNIVIHPIDQSLSVNNREPTQLNFTLINDNFARCESRCRLSLRDGRNRIFANETIGLSHGQELERTYTVPAQGRGSGQQLFLFEAECANVRSLLCQTSSTPRYASSLVTLNYGLSEEDQRKKEEVRPALQEFLDTYRNASAEQVEARAYAAQLPAHAIESISLQERLHNNSAALSQLSDDQLHLVALWKNESFTLLDSINYAYYATQLESLSQDLLAIEQETTAMVNVYNDDAVLFSSVVVNASNITAAATWLAQDPTADRKDIAEQLLASSRRIAQYEALLDSNNSFSLRQMTQDLRQEVNETQRLVGLQQDMYQQAAQVLGYGWDMLDLKNMTARRGNVSCDTMENVTQTLREANEAARALRVSAYNETIGNATVDDALADYAQHLAARNASQFSSVLSQDMLDALVIMDLTLLENYIQENCTLATPSRHGELVGQELAKLRAVDSLPLTVPVANVSAITLTDPAPVCCSLGACGACCDGCDKPNPVLFLHGHAFNEENTPEYSMSSFTKLQRRLEQEGYINAGQLDLGKDLETVSQGEWGQLVHPVSMRASYYYITYFGVGRYLVATQKSERIENYALRLRDIIEQVKYRTGAEKVDIVAHSMGGLVVREYISLFGEEDIGKVIFINTPHLGVQGRVKDLCGVFSSSEECEDLATGSVFLNRLNARKIPSESFAIRSVGCAMAEGNGDGIVTSEHAYLEGAQNYVINGACTDALNSDLHSRVLDPDEFPELYALLVGILKK